MSLKRDDLMFALSFCLVIGFTQVFILKGIIKWVFAGNFIKTVITILIKFAVYAVGFTFMYFCLLDYKYHCAAGFALGVISAVVIIFIKSKKQVA